MNKNRQILEEHIDEYNKRELERKARVMEYWNNLKHFNNPNDIPNIPICDKEEYNEFYLPKLINAGAIRKMDLFHGQIYIGKHRRCTVARWNEDDQKFEYWRNKFGHWFIDTCNHFEDDDGFALFVPIKHGTIEDFKQPEN